MAPENNLAEGDQDFGQNQDHDCRFEPCRPVGVDQFGERARGFDEYRACALTFRALLEFVFILKAGIKPLQIGPIPQHVGLFLDGDTAR